MSGRAGTARTGAQKQEVGGELVWKRHRGHPGDKHRRVVLWVQVLGLVSLSWRQGQFPGCAGHTRVPTGLAGGVLGAVLWDSALALWELTLSWGI